MGEMICNNCARDYKHEFQDRNAPEFNNKPTDEDESTINKMENR